MIGQRAGQNVGKGGQPGTKSAMATAMNGKVRASNSSANSPQDDGAHSSFAVSNPGKQAQSSDASNGY